MANEQNLRPPFTPKEAREYGRKGAAALTKRMMEVMEAIDALPDPEADASPLDAAKRKRGGA